MQSNIYKGAVDLFLQLSQQWFFCNESKPVEGLFGLSLILILERCKMIGRLAVVCALISLFTAVDSYHHASRAFRPNTHFNRALYIGSTTCIHSLPLSASPTVSSTKPLDAPNSEIWWQEGLKFGCTACGKCCQNEGEVWMDSDEFADLTIHLEESPKNVLEKYSEKVMNGWVKMKSKGSDSQNPSDVIDSNRCIFLGENGKECSIYELRPTQCRTYPFWPRLLESSESWEEESVSVRDKENILDENIPTESILHSSSNENGGTAESIKNDVDVGSTVNIENEGIISSGEMNKIKNKKYWTPTTGGCEGIGQPDTPLIGTRTIHRNQELYKMYTEKFPFSGKVGEREKLLEKTNIIHVRTYVLIVSIAQYSFSCVCIDCLFLPFSIFFLFCF